MFYWLCPLIYRRFSVSWGPIYQFLILEPEPLEFYVEVLDPLALDLCTRWQIWINFHFLYTYWQIEQCHLLKMLPFFHCIVLVFVKDQLSISMWFYFLVFNFIPLINVSVSIPIPFSFYHYCSEYSLSSGIIIPL